MVIGQMVLQPLEVLSKYLDCAQGLCVVPTHWLKGEKSHGGKDILGERPATLREGQALMAAV